MNPIRFTLLVCLVAILMTIIAALLSPFAPANQAEYPGANQPSWNRLGQPAAGGTSGERAAPANCSPNCFP